MAKRRTGETENRGQQAEGKNQQPAGRWQLAAGAISGLESKDEEPEGMNQGQPEQLKARARHAYLRRSLANSSSVMSASWRI